MVIKYKNFNGTVILLEQLQEAQYHIKLDDDNTIISFVCDIHEIELVNCPANYYLIDKFKNK